MKNLVIFASLIIVSSLFTDAVHAQRRGGGGRSMGGGGGRSFSGGGASNFNRPSSMGSSRPATSNFQRPATSNYQRPATTNRQRPASSNLQRPASSNLQRPTNSNRARPASSPNRPSTGSFPRPAGSSSRVGGNSASNNRQYQRPSSNQLNDFLNMPKSSSASKNSPASRNAPSTRERSNSASSPNEAGGRTFSGDNYTVDTFKGKGSGSSDGTNFGGAGAGAVITDSEGNKRVVGKGVAGASDGTNKVVGSGGFAAGTNTDGSAGAVRGGTRVATDGTNVGVARGGAGVARDSQGNVRAGAAGGYAATDGKNTVAGAGSIRGQSNVDGSGGYVARGARGATDGTNTVVQRGAQAEVRDQYGNQRGGRVAGTRTTDGFGNTKGEIRGSSYYKGPGGNVYAKSTYARGYNGIVTNYNQVYGVRTGFGGYNTYYRANWYARYPGAWYVAGITAAAWWMTPSYGYASGYTGCTEEPVSYDYGDEGIYVEDGNVYIGEEAIATEDEYYEQATEIADSFQEEAADPNDGADPSEAAAEDAGDWLPLGVFGVVSEGQTKSDMTLQLAVSKEGMIRGNLTIDLTDEVLPIKGTVDKETQRVAFRIEGKDNIVVEAGLYNLTEDVLTVLVHYGKDRQEERGLIRLKPEEESDDKNSAPAADAQDQTPANGQK